MIQRLQRAGVATAVTLGLAFSAPLALAQTPPAAPPPQAPAQAASSNTGPAPTDTELKEFAHAVLDVQALKNSLQPKLAAAATPAARQKIEQASEKQMEAVVRQHDLSVHRYVQIAKVVQTNNAVRAKVQSYMPPAPAASSSS